HLANTFAGRRQRSAYFPVHEFEHGTGRMRSQWVGNLLAADLRLDGRQQVRAHRRRVASLYAGFPLLSPGLRSQAGRARGHPFPETHLRSQKNAVAARRIRPAIGIRGDDDAGHHGVVHAVADRLGPPERVQLDAVAEFVCTLTPDASPETML